MDFMATQKSTHFQMWYLNLTMLVKTKKLWGERKFIFSPAIIRWWMPCLCVYGCVCVCVCVSQWKKVPDEWQARQATPAILCVCVRACARSIKAMQIRFPFWSLSYFFPAWGAWSSGACSVTCGHGVIRRWRSCIPGSAGSPPCSQLMRNGLHNTTEKCFLRSCPAGSQEGGHAATGKKA